MDTGVHAVTVAVVDAEELHAAAKFLGERDILGGNLGNTGDVNLFEVHALAAAKASEEGGLVGGVDTFDIESRVSFSKAELLGVLQDDVEIETFFGHAAQDVVASTVNDAAQAFDRGAQQAFLEAADDRNATADSSFEQHMEALLGSERENFVTILGEESLVGRHHVLTAFEGGEDPLARHVVATGEFHKHVDIIASNHFVGIGRDLVALGLVRGHFFFGLSADASELQFNAKLFLIFGNLLFKNLNDTTTNGTRAN